MLVVISIIARLLAVLIPSLSKAREVAYRVICGHHLKDFGTANTAYSVTCPGFFLPVEYLDPNPKGATHKFSSSYDDIRWLHNRLFKSYLNYDSYPKDKKNAPKPGSAQWNGYNGSYNMPKAILCPTDRISTDWLNCLSNVLVSYGYNSTDFPINWSGGAPENDYMGYKVSDVRQPSAKLIFIDTIDWWTGWSGADYRRGWDKRHQMNIGAYRGQGEARGKGWPDVYGPVIYRHSEGANCVFYDGHIKYMKKQEIYNPPRSFSMWSANQ
ncbi:MAG: H-X9-DG-CTERM domain-containing protein [Sedimentisphaerales bacterium]